MSHIPVMVREVISYIVTDPYGVYVDATAGCGGHTKAILDATSGRVIAIEWDRKSLAVLEDALQGYIKAGRLEIVCGSYALLSSAIEGVEGVCGVLFDFGVSSFQLDDPSRGFSFRFQGPLDMRMSGDIQMTAGDLITSVSEEELFKILWRYGEERFAKRIARAIKEYLPQTTEELALVVRKVVPRARAHKHLARVFQALRIAVNDELNNIERGLQEAVLCLVQGGRLVTLTYHSLEDRIVKHFGMGHSSLKVLTKRVVKPSKEEFQANPRARSAKLRAFEKV